VSCNCFRCGRGSPSLVGRGIANLSPHSQLSSSFEDYLRSQNRRNIKQIVSYASRYHGILQSGEATTLAGLRPAVRRHTMESLTAYSKYMGCYDRWQEIRRRYQLHWTDGNESVQALQRFFDTNLSLESMIDKVRKMLQVLPVEHMGTIVQHALLTGLRPIGAATDPYKPVY
jgi:hypothetical protein